ncbi:serine/threonine protein kinase [Akkermansiaceae bacterium]|nr:serine/threonine protein kinase [Akkermansiaceae bacterium]
MTEYSIGDQKVPSAEEVNLLFDGYDVQMLIGVGSVGAIYYALKENKAYAIKLLIFRKEIRTMLEFKSEAECLAALDHPYIVKTYGYGEVADYPYIISDYVERGTLHHVSQEFSFDTAAIVRLGVMLCEAVIHLHGKGYIHRDLKPDNIMLNGEWFPILIDFGLAINLNNIVHYPKAVGSLGYAAPEIKLNPKTVDYRVDVYAIGAILYTLAIKEIPGEIVDITKLNGIEPRLRMIIGRATQQDLEKRTADVDGIRDKLVNLRNSLELQKD